MNNQTCIFCKIVKGEIPADFTLKTKDTVVFADIKPTAPLHLLIVPKKHISHFALLENVDKKIWGEMTKVARDLISRHDLSEKGYRIILNGGPAAMVQHLHMHLLGEVSIHKEI